MTASHLRSSNYEDLGSSYTFSSYINGGLERGKGCILSGVETNVGTRIIVDSASGERHWGVGYAPTSAPVSDHLEGSMMMR